VAQSTILRAERAETALKETQRREAEERLQKEEERRQKDEERRQKEEERRQKEEERRQKEEERRQKEVVIKVLVAKGMPEDAVRKLLKSPTGD
jgi:hypothetical protein